LTIELRLFAVAKDLLGQERLEVEVSDNATIGDLRRALTEASPSLARLVPHLMFAINAQYAADGTAIPAGAEVACIPPVSGG
jgi:molybdopterin converting factor subunit 1